MCNDELPSNVPFRLPKIFYLYKRDKIDILREKEEAMQKEDAHICLLPVDVPQILNIKTINNIVGKQPGVTNKTTSELFSVPWPHYSQAEASRYSNTGDFQIKISSASNYPPGEFYLKNSLDTVITSINFTFPFIDLRVRDSKHE